MEDGRKPGSIKTEKDSLMESFVKALITLIVCEDKPFAAVISNPYSTKRVSKGARFLSELSSITIRTVFEFSLIVITAVYCVEIGRNF